MGIILMLLTSRVCLFSGGGFSAPVQLSNELTAFFGGESSMPRTEVTKRIWVYIKEHNLQNPSDKREILCDAELQKIFKKSKVNMFKMAKYLSEVCHSPTL